VGHNPTLLDLHLVECYIEMMSAPLIKTDRTDWHLPQPDKAAPEAGYDAWLAEEIAAGTAELDAGLGIPAAQIWKDLGIE
jgi:hypothetical protein